MVAPPLIVAIRTAKWAAKNSPGALLSDMDDDLDREIGFAVRVTDRILKALLQHKGGLFPERLQAFYKATEDDVPK